jgi:hypothetical protein
MRVSASEGIRLNSLRLGNLYASLIVVAQNYDAFVGAGFVVFSGAVRATDRSISASQMNFSGFRVPQPAIKKSCPMREAFGSWIRTASP